MYVFDLDGTLVSSVDAHISAWIDALKVFGIARKREEIAPLMGLPAREIAERLLPNKGAELAQIKNKIFLEKYLKFVKPYDDVEVLARLPKPIAVVTSSNGDVARAILREVKLAKYIDVVIGGDEVDRGKPAPDPLYLLSTLVKIPTVDMVVVGDSAYDIEMALNAGAMAVCITRGKPPCSTKARVIENLFEL